MVTHNIAIIGSGTLAQTCALLLVQSVSVRKAHASDIVKSVILIDEAKNLKHTQNPLYFVKKENAVETIGYALEKINAGMFQYYGTNIMPLQISPMPYFSLMEADPYIAEPARPQIIIDCKNDEESQKDTQKYAKQVGAQVIRGSAGKHAGDYAFNCTQCNISEDAEQGVITSGVIGGMILDNLKKSFNKEPIFPKFSFSSPDDKCDLDSILRGKKIAVIGAGALGNVTVPELVLSGAEVLMADYDTIEAKNFDRQYMYFPEESTQVIGAHKAFIFEKRANKLAENNHSGGACKGFIKKIETEKDLDELAHDASAILLNVDNDLARMLVSDYSIKNNKPAIDVAIDDSGGRTAGFYPGRTKCLTHKLAYEPTRGQPCGDVAVTARILGSASVVELIASLAGNPLCGGSIWYEYDEQNQVTTFKIKENKEVDPKCTCTPALQHDKNLLIKRYPSFLFDDRMGPKKISCGIINNVLKN